MSATLNLSFFGARRRLPMLLQTEASECGLISLAMVADYHGLRMDPSTLRQRFPISRKGCTLESLLQMAHDLQLEARPLKLDLDALHELMLPCVLHWDMNHFVVLKSVSARTLVVHDPAVGERRFTPEAFGQHFTGIALELSPAQGFESRDERRSVPLRRLIGPVQGLGRGLAQVLSLALVLELFAMLAPLLLQWVTDQVVVTEDRELLAVLGVGFLLLVLIQGAVGALRSWLVVTLSTQLNFQWLGRVFRHLLRLPLDYYEKRHVGHIVSCFGSINHIQTTLTHGVVEAVVDGVMVLGTLVVMLLYAAELTAWVLGAVVLYALLRRALYHRLREATAEKILHEAHQQTHFLESVAGAQSIRLFGRAQMRRVGWMNLLADQFNAELRIGRLHIGYETANKLLFGIERVVIVWLAALAVLDQRMTLGMLLAFIAYKDQFSTRVSALVDKAFDLRMLELHLQRVADIVLTEPEPVAAPRTETDLSHIEGRLQLQRVAFAYAAHEARVLDGVTLTIEPGECVALTGASGCGKTTLVKLLLGLLTPTEGEVLLDGQPIRWLGLDAYRSLIGTVMQDDRLFTGSIADNIAFFDPTPDTAWIEACAVQASIHADIEAMPMGYHTLVGDIGHGLSGGQKQRILLARALYRRPRILVLDEATSHLDVLHERGVNEAVKAMRLTRVIVAHRPETIAMADRVVVLDRGRIVRDFGTHERAATREPTPAETIVSRA